MVDSLKSVILPSPNLINLELTLNSGQSFRWIRKGSLFEGILGDSLVCLRDNGKSIELINCEADTERILNLLRYYFRLDDRWDEIVEALDKDTHVAQALLKYQGLRLLNQDPWETLIAFVTSSVSSIAKVSYCLEGLCQQFGSRLSLGTSARRAFPSPYELARASEKELRSVGLGFRARYVKEIAQYFASNEIKLEFLKERPYEDAKQWLMELPGIGPKVADCVLLYSLDKTQAFPVDRWIERVLDNWYSAHKRRWVKDTHKWAGQHFGEYAGYAELYLFQHIRTDSRQRNRK